MNLKKVDFLVAFFLGLWFIFNNTSCQKEEITGGNKPGKEDSLIISFTENELNLKNPHRGFQTEGRSWSHESSLTKYDIPSSSIYRRFYWYQLEPQKERYDFSAIDQLLDAGEAEGQCFSFRVMCIASPGDRRDVTPQWFQNTACNHWYLNGVNYIPDMDDPIFKKYLYGLIRKLGERYAEDPRLEMVDIGIVGLWGEWHNGDNTDFQLPSVETRKEIVDLFRETFPNQYKIINIESFEDHILEYAVSKGCGVRTDGMGDQWHENKFFPNEFAKVPEAWKNAPLEGEAYELINQWDDPSWHGGQNNGLTNTINNALAHHYSFFNWMHGSTITSDQMLAEVKRFERKLGYRLLLKKFVSAKNIKHDESYRVWLEWENTGAAPPYWDYYLSYMFVREAASDSFFVYTEETVKGWLPGSLAISQSISLPNDMPSGKYSIYIGLTDPVNHKAAIQLAMDCERKENWYKMGIITLQ